MEKITRRDLFLRKFELFKCLFCREIKSSVNPLNVKSFAYLQEKQNY